MGFLYRLFSLNDSLAGFAGSYPRHPKKKQEGKRKTFPMRKRSQKKRHQPSPSPPPLDQVDQRNQQKIGSKIHLKLKGPFCLKKFTANSHQKAAKKNQAESMTQQKTQPNPENPPHPPGFPPPGPFTPLCLTLRPFDVSAFLPFRRLLGDNGKATVFFTGFAGAYEWGCGWWWMMVASPYTSRE